MATVHATPLSLLISLLGKVLSIEKILPFGRLQFRQVQANVVHELKDGRSFRFSVLDRIARDDFIWWGEPWHLQHWVTARLAKLQFVIHTDASMQG